MGVGPSRGDPAAHPVGAPVLRRGGVDLTIGDYYYQKLTIGGCHYYYYYYYYYYRSTTTTTTTTTTTNTNKCRTDSAWISDVDWFYFFKSLVSRRTQRGRECPSQI